MVVTVMGVTGSGKTTVGRMLAQQLGWTFADADDFHPRENIGKMARGIPLDEADRAPWLAAMRNAIERWLREGQSAVLACSALKRAYRDELLVNDSVRLVYLRGDYDVIVCRVRQRTGHFAKSELVASQFTDLEEPGSEALTLDIADSPETIVAKARQLLGIA